MGERRDAVRHEKHLLNKGQRIEVEVLDNGFLYDGTVYTSLSAVAKAITGTHCSGRAFFGLAGKE